MKIFGEGGDGGFARDSSQLLEELWSFDPPRYIGDSTTHTAGTLLHMLPIDLPHRQELFFSHVFTGGRHG